jgi:hypothetical protein
MIPRKILWEKVLIIKVVCNLVCFSCMCLSKDENKPAPFQVKTNLMLYMFIMLSQSSDFQTMVLRKTQISTTILALNPWPIS